MLENTIVAPITALGGAVATVRISGDKTRSILEKLCHKSAIQFVPRTQHFCKLFGADAQLLDEGLVTFFPAPNSYTGEDVAEISVHASEFIIQELISNIVNLGAIPAMAGEFTQRAYLLGKLDLAQAEAVADIIAADSAAAHKLALQQLKGGVSSEIKGLREKLTKYCALLELELDFAEEDVEFANRKEFEQLLLQIESTIEQLSSSFQLGNAIKGGIPIAILGEPNAGKSSLLNALLQEKRAIVSPIAGTTRDFIEDEFYIEKAKFRLIDTAGIRQETEDEIEKIGIGLAFEKALVAEIILAVFDSSIENSFENCKKLLVKNGVELDKKKIIWIGNKIDLVKEIRDQREENKLFLSTQNQENIEQLKKKIYCISGVEKLQTENQIIITNMRHVEVLQKALLIIQTSLNGLKNELSSELLAFEIKRAIQILGSITGEIETEEILGYIFSKFCIGK